MVSNELKKFDKNTIIITWTYSPDSKHWNKQFGTLDFQKIIISSSEDDIKLNNETPNMKDEKSIRNTF